MSDFVCCLCNEDRMSYSSLERHIDEVHWDILKDAKPSGEENQEAGSTMARILEAEPGRSVSEKLQAENLPKLTAANSSIDCTDIDQETSLDISKRVCPELHLSRRKKSADPEQLAQDDTTDPKTGDSIIQNEAEPGQEIIASSSKKVCPKSNETLTTSANVEPVASDYSSQNPSYECDSQAENSGSGSIGIHAQNAQESPKNDHDHLTTIKSFYCYYCKVGGDTVDQLQDHIKTSDHRCKERSTKSPMKFDVSNVPKKKRFRKRGGVFVSLGEFSCTDCGFQTTSRPLFYCPTHKLRCKESGTRKPIIPLTPKSESKIDGPQIDSLANDIDSLKISPSVGDGNVGGASFRRKLDFSPTAILPEREGSNSKLNPTIKDPDEADATQKIFSKNPESSSGARVTPEKEKYQTNLKAEINASGKAKAYCQICKQMYSSSQSLRRHFRRMHSNAQEIDVPDVQNGLTNPCQPTDGLTNLTEIEPKIGRKRKRSDRSLQDEECKTPKTDFSCRTCGESFHSASQLRVHVVKSHNVMPSTSATTPSTSRTLTSQAAISQTLTSQAVIGQTSPQNVTEAVPSTSSQTPIDIVSSGAFLQNLGSTQASNLKSDEETSHTLSRTMAADNIDRGKNIANDSTYCFICQHRFPTKANLRRHNLRKHTEGAKVPCPECDRQFKIFYDMKRHLRNTHNKFL